MEINRRYAMKVVAGACLSGAVPVFGAKKKPRKKIPIGLQLYAVRGSFQKDVEGTLKKTAALGYKGVEFWGYGGGPVVYKGRTAPQFRRLLDSLKLKCCGMHVQLKAIQGDLFNQTVKVNKTLGNKFMIVAAAAQQMKSVDSIKRYAEILSDAAEKAKKMKMRVGYHCHPFDFKRFDGRTGWDILFSNTSKDVVMQLDIGNCAGGGGDPLAILKKFPGRSKTVHIKEFKGLELKKGNEKWEEILTVCEKQHKSEWYIVEVGDQGGVGFVNAERCLKALHEMGR